MTPRPVRRANDAAAARAAILAPGGTVDRAWRPRAGLRDAAVLAPVFLRDGEPHLLLTRRRDDLPDHPGQVAFPGGAREGGEDALACALRESAEEVGIDPAAVDVLRRLPDRVSIAGFHVAAFVGRIPGPDGLVPDAAEVARLFDVPFSVLLDRRRWRTEDRRTPMGTFRDVPFLEWDGEVVWGLTGMFARDLVEAIRPADGGGRVGRRRPVPAGGPP